jgi:hypothetical protein
VRELIFTKLVNKTNGSNFIPLRYLFFLFVKKIHIATLTAISSMLVRWQCRPGEGLFLSGGTYQRSGLKTAAYREHIISPPGLGGNKKAHPVSQMSLI